MDRLITALRHIQDFAKDKDVLIQLWVPVNRGNERVLTTNKLPFCLDPVSGKLSGYREISLNYQFSAEEDSKELVGLPSRVFFGKVPEWSPDVRFFKSEEYQRLDHAQQFDIRGTLALPVFEQGSRTCLGVIEVVMITQKIKYRPEIETVCKALEAVDMRSSRSCSSPCSELMLVCTGSTRPAQRGEKEIIDIEESLDRHHLPDSLAEGGRDCYLLGKGSCSKAAKAKKGNRKRSKAEKSITLDALRQYFSGSLKDAAKGLGVCPTTLKRICRQHGIKRWPSRKIKKVDHSLQKLQHVIKSVQGAPSSLQIGSFYKEFPDLASPNVITTRSSNVKLNDSYKSSWSPSLSCSVGSNSRHGCSSGERQNPSKGDVNGEEDNIAREDGDNIDGTQLRKVRSHGELNGSSTKEAEEVSRFLLRSQSHKSFEPDPESLLPSPEKPMQNAPGEGRPLRIKASYAGNKVRFRMQPHWGLSKLWRELATRFNIEDISKLDLNYLNDDLEWVL
ncbi:hypothetical protein MLD38_035027 [Melastoma candidum]|uniref:Uncharacterized protein n=1 Tax=Melastoma candidum TaxID=119954 RepID=A0ACB9MBW7_9MYRT|nr:hypothetical protein MLD38_035027 [Melastoma candidum]